MAHVAQTKLLCAVMVAGLASALAPASAQTSQTDEPPVNFAPGATGPIEAPLLDMLRDAKRRGEELRGSLRIQDPQAGVEIDNLAGIRARAMNDPRVRALLGVEDEPVSEDAAEKYAETRAILFASFSMPETSLRQMMREATAYGVTIVFRGFVNNSVFDTREKLEQVFGDDDEAEAFAIDPTLFRRFDIQAVPALVVLGETLDVCETPLCADDIAPVHDRLSGNIPLEAALSIIAAGRGDAEQTARALLEHRP